MKCDRYLLTHIKKMDGSLKGFNQIIGEKVVWMPQEAEAFNKKLERHREDLKKGETMTFHKVTLGKRYYQIEAAE